MSPLLATLAAAGRGVVPWPWPLAPVFILVLLTVAALVLYAVYHYIIQGKE